MSHSWLSSRSNSMSLFWSMVTIKLICSLSVYSRTQTKRAQKRQISVVYATKSVLTRYPDFAIKYLAIIVCILNKKVIHFIKTNVLTAITWMFIHVMSVLSIIFVCTVKCNLIPVYTNIILKINGCVFIPLILWYKKNLCINTDEAELTRLKYIYNIY